MSRSQPKPKIIYKNLQEVIRSSSTHKNQKNKCNSHRGQLSKQLAQITNYRHVANSASERKTKYINVGKTQIGENVSATEIYNNYFNQIDAIYTDIEDFLCQSKERVLKDMRNSLKDTFKQKSKAISQIEEMKQMSDYIKQITTFFTAGENQKIRTQISDNMVEKPRAQSKTTHTEANDQQMSKIGGLSLKNSKVRSNRRGQMINIRKKTVYQQILEERQGRNKVTSISGKKIRG